MGQRQIREKYRRDFFNTLLVGVNLVLTKVSPGPGQRRARHEEVATWCVTIHLRRRIASGDCQCLIVGDAGWFNSSVRVGEKALRGRRSIALGFFVSAGRFMARSKLA